MFRVLNLENSFSEANRAPLLCQHRRFMTPIHTFLQLFKITIIGKKMRTRPKKLMHLYRLDTYQHSDCAVCLLKMKAVYL